MHRNIRLLKWFNFFADFRLYAPIAIIYFSHISGSYALGIAVFSIASIASAVLEIPTGIFSDMIGRRKTILLGALASACSLVTYALSGSFFVLAIGGLLEGLAQALFSGNNKAFLYDTLKEHGEENEFPKWLGKCGAMFQIALGISAFLGGFIAEYSLLLVIWLSVIPQIISFLIALNMREPAIHSNEAESTNIYSHLREAFKRFKEDYQLRMISLASIIDAAIEEGMYTFYPVFFALLWPTWAIGIVRALSNATSAMGYWFADRLIKKFNAFRVLIGGEIYMRIVGIAATVYPTIISPFLLSLDFVHGSRMISQDTLLQERFTDRQRATMGSLNTLFGSTLFALYAYGIGYVADMWSPVKAILISQLLLVTIIILYSMAYRRKKLAS